MHKPRTTERWVVVHTDNPALEKRRKRNNKFKIIFSSIRFYVKIKN